MASALLILGTPCVGVLRLWTCLSTNSVVIMIKHEPKVCLFCEEQFEPHPQVGSRQLACKKSQCRRQRVKRTKKLWSEQDPACNYSYVKKYRLEHPHYQKQWRRKRKQQLHVAQADLVDTCPPASTTQPDGPPLGDSEIRNQLSLTKTTTQLNLHPGEIRNQLSLCITVPLMELLSLCSQTAAGEVEIRNHLPA